MKQRIERITHILTKAAVAHDVREQEKIIVIYDKSLDAKLVTSISVIGYKSIGLYASKVSEIAINNMLCINL